MAFLRNTLCAIFAAMVAGSSLAIIQNRPREAEQVAMRVESVNKPTHQEPADAPPGSFDNPEPETDFSGPMNEYFMLLPYVFETIQSSESYVVSALYAVDGDGEPSVLTAHYQRSGIIISRALNTGDFFITHSDTGVRVAVTFAEAEYDVLDRYFRDIKQEYDATLTYALDYNDRDICEAQVQRSSAGRSFISVKCSPGINA